MKELCIQHINVNRINKIIKKNNLDIIIPSNTYVQIPNYLRHRDKKCWVEPKKFNPYRDFTNDELEAIKNLGFITPESYRFSPFLHNNRACIGKMFSLIEMRLILLYLLKDFTFLLHKDSNVKSFNLGTMAPKNLFVSIIDSNSKI